MNKFFDFLKTKFFKQYNHIENRIFFLFLLVSCLFIILRDKIELYVLGSYFLLSLLFIPTFTCFIDGNCYMNVYLLIFAFVISNILFFIFYDIIQQQFPKTFKKLNSDKEKLPSKEIYKDLGKDVYNKINKKRKNYLLEREQLKSKTINK